MAGSEEFILSRKNNIFASQIKIYLSNLFFIGLAFFFYTFIPYYPKFINEETRNFLIFLIISYFLAAPLIYLFFPSADPKKNKSLMLTRALWRIIKNFKNYYRKSLADPNFSPAWLSKEEKTALLFFLVKFFFLPIMLNFAFSNYHSFLNGYRQLKTNYLELDIAFFNTFIYPCLLSLVFVIDTVFFAFGYTLEAGFLKNKVRSVEPTLLGWTVALVCYPPFNQVLGSNLGWYASDYVVYKGETITFILRLAVLLSYFIYVGATVALGTKCSNLTNRGIVSRFPYSIVRHPAYSAKNLSWWLTIIPVLSVTSVLVMGVWTIIYMLRAFTEERHLLQDPDYQEYCKKVKYRFIPFVF